jgi:hypothetical protein
MGARMFAVAATLSLFSIQYASAALDAATVEAVWLFDETTGDIAEDSSGNGRHGDLEGGSEWTTGVFGGAYSPDGVDGEIVITGYKGIGGTQERTTVVWYRTDVSGDQRLVSYGANANAAKYHVRVHDGTTLRVETQDGQLFANEPDITDGEWHHLAVVLPPGSTMCHDHLLYVDGVHITNTGGTDVGVDTDVTQHDVEIGYDKFIGHGSPASGEIDEVALFSVALSENDINAIMNNGLVGALAVSPAGKLATKWGALKDVR